MVVAPALGLAYLRRDARGAARPGDAASRSAGTSGVWVHPGRGPGGQRVLVAARDLAGVDQGGADFAFTHPEGVFGRLGQIVDDRGADRERALGGWPAGPGRPGAARPGRGGRPAGRSWRPGSSGATSPAASGRSTSSSRAGTPTPSTRRPALAGGVGVDRDLARGSGARGAGRLDRWLALGGGRWSGSGCFGPSRGRRRVRTRFAARAVPVEPALAPAALGGRRVKRHVQPGERLLYEEGGMALPGFPDPFQGGRYSGLLALPDRGRGARRPLPARRREDELHPVWRGQAVRRGGLGPRPFRAVRPALPAGGDPLLEPARPGVLPGEPRPDRGARR